MVLIVLLKKISVVVSQQEISNSTWKSKRKEQNDSIDYNRSVVEKCDLKTIQESGDVNRSY